MIEKVLFKKTYPKIREKLKILKILNINKTLFSDMPFARSLWDIWSVPPVVGATPLLNLPSKIINKSKRGMVKNSINGLSV